MCQTCPKQLSESLCFTNTKFQPQVWTEKRNFYPCRSEFDLHMSLSSDCVVFYLRLAVLRVLNREKHSTPRLCTKTRKKKWLEAEICGMQTDILLDICFLSSFHNLLCIYIVGTVEPGFNEVPRAGLEKCVR